MRPPKEAVIKQEISNLTDDIRRSLLRIENRVRRAQHLHPLSPNTKIWMYSQPKALFQLMNLKVWSMRYCVSLDFVLESLFNHFKNIRRHDGPNIGIPVSTLTGPGARKALERAVERAYPFGENYRSSVTTLPIKSLQYETPDEFVKMYHESIQARRKREEPSYPRNFRKEKQRVKF